MDWFYAIDDQKHGPISEEELKQMLASGSLISTALVWCEDMGGDWKPAAEVPQLNTGSAPAGSTPPPTPSSAPAGSAPAATSTGGSQAPATQPGQAGQVVAVNIPNYLAQSIIASVLCCLPFGIVGIIHAAKVNDLIAQGRIDEARDASNKAKLWTNISVIVGLVGGLAYVGLAILGGAMEG